MLVKGNAQWQRFLFQEMNHPRTEANPTMTCCCAFLRRRNETGPARELRALSPSSAPPALHLLHQNWKIGLELGEAQGGALPPRVPRGADHTVGDTGQAAAEGQARCYVHHPGRDFDVLNNPQVVEGREHEEAEEDGHACGEGIQGGRRGVS